MLQGIESVTPCAAEASDPPPAVAPVATTTFGVGEGVDFSQGYRFSASIEAFADPSLVVEGSDGRTLNHGLEVVAPRVSTVQPTGIFSDGASFVVTSGSDPSRLEVLVQNGDELRALDPVGEVPLENAGAVRTWLTQNGALVSVVAGPPDRHRLLRRHR